MSVDLLCLGRFLLPFCSSGPSEQRTATKMQRGYANHSTTSNLQGGDVRSVQSWIILLQNGKDVPPLTYMRKWIRQHVSVWEVQISRTQTRRYPALVFSSTHSIDRHCSAPDIIPRCIIDRTSRIDCQLAFVGVCHDVNGPFSYGNSINWAVRRRTGIDNSVWQQLSHIWRPSAPKYPHVLIIRYLLPDDVQTSPIIRSRCS